MLKLWLLLMLWLPSVLARGGGHAGAAHGLGSESESDFELSSDGGKKESNHKSNPHNPHGENPPTSKYVKSSKGHKTRPLLVRHTGSTRSRSRRRRTVAHHGSHTMSLALPTIPLNRNNDSLYYANVSIGTPGQEQPLIVDIVQPYNWVVSNSSKTRNNHSNSLSDSYQSSRSKTSEHRDGSRIYHLNFVDSESINATAVMDTITFEPLVFENQTNHPINHSRNENSGAFYDSHTLKLSNSSFFDVNGTSSSTGVLGLGGRITDEGTDIDSSQYDKSFFILENLKENGFINSSSYSLWLGGDTRPYYNIGRPNIPDEIHCGKIILGGVDPFYYSGSLKKFNKLTFLDYKTDALSRGYPVLPMRTINVVSSIGRSINVTTENFLAPVLLDSRYSFSHLPSEAIIQIAVQIGAIYVKELDRFIVPCEIADMGVSIQFEFGNLSIDVPLTDFLMSTFSTGLNSTMRFSGGAEACFVTMVSSEETGFNILGTPFLRNVYLVVDHEDHSIAIAQARREHITTITPDAGNSASATVTTSCYLSPSLSSTSRPKPITSGSIPYAMSSNESLSLTLSPSHVSSRETHVPDQFTAIVFSDGLVSTGRSLYNTYRSTSSSKTVPTDFASFSVTSAQHSRSTGHTGKKYSGAHKLKPPEMGNKHWISHIFSLLFVVVLFMVW